MNLLKKNKPYSLWHTEKGEEHHYIINSGYLVLAEFHSKDNTAYKEAIKFYDEIVKK